MSEERDNIVVLVDQEENEIEFEFLDTVEYKGANFAVLLPVDNEDTGEVYIFSIVEDEEGESFFDAVEDDAVIDEVFNLFRENNQEEFDFSD